LETRWLANSYAGLLATWGDSKAPAPERPMIPPPPLPDLGPLALAGGGFSHTPTSANMNDPNTAPTIEVLAELHNFRDESVIVIALVAHPSGRPPALSLRRRLATGASYHISLSPMDRAAIGDAVERWCQLADAHEAVERPRPGRPRAERPS
jgi:hypothetical protein